ncbi:MAG: hypothetical protein O3C28_03975 [Proteobacteria bacterium]|nr:hypothetical protein [Pseudomonadota bacterium]
MKILAIVGPILLGSSLMIVGAAGAYWYLEANDTAVQKHERALEKEPTTRTTNVPKRIDREGIRQLLAFMDEARRTAILNSEEEFNAFVEQERANQAVLVAANANQAHVDESVSTLMERAAQKVLATAYLGQVVQRNLDSAFPNEVQSREYYADGVATPNAASGRLRKIGSAALLNSMIHQMGGALTSSARGTFVDISI